MCFNHQLLAQSKANFDEDSVGAYELPELLTFLNGEKVQNAKNWGNFRRKEILELFENEVYGRLPESVLYPITIKIEEESDSALKGKAIRKQVSLLFSSRGKSIKINVLLYSPVGIQLAPVFLGYNFNGNHTIIDDQEVLLTQSWLPNNDNLGVIDNRASNEGRGKRSHRWPIQDIIDEGFALATVYYGDVDPDTNDFTDGIHPLFYKGGQESPKANEWGAISAWAWGISKVLDYLKSDELLSKSKFILLGHSRLGKSALWAGALDERFDMVISNNSGCGGAALFRRNFGETVGIINKSFPHWFADNFNKYSSDVSLLPVDQHMLVALIAPRPVYIASAQNDHWADPRGEYLSGYFASPVFELYNKEGLRNLELPETNKPILNTIGYHIREGQHDMTHYDWEQFIRFARLHF
jgi:hypothetical protein